MSMRFLALPIAVFMVAMPAVAAQAPERGDQEMAAASIAGSGWVAAEPLGLFRDADIVNLGLAGDNASTVTLRLELATLIPDSFPKRGDFSQRYEVAFTLRDEGFVLSMNADNGPEGPWRGSLGKVADGQAFMFARVPVRAEGNALWAAVPRAALAAADGTVPAKGAELRDMTATARIEQLQGFRCDGAEPAQACAIKARDVFPNAGAAGPFALQSESGALHGSLRITVPTPVRASNGQATTHLFEIVLRNEGAAADVVALGLRDAPREWTVSVPGSVRLEAKESRTVVLAISVPFAHQHSILRSLNLTVASSSTEQPAVLPLGIYWIDPPQPAGHHDTLFVHYDLAPGPKPFASKDGLWLDTRADQSTPGPISLFRSVKQDGATARVSSYRVDTPLGGGLLIGLDADMARQGLLRFELDSSVEGNAVFEARLRFQPSAQEGQPDATVFTVAPQAVTAKPGPLVIEAPIAAVPAGDLVAVRLPGQLLLDFWLNMTLPAVDYLPSQGLDDFRMAPDVSFLRLPLLEYQAPVPPATGDASFSLRPTTPVEVRRAPGATALFRLVAEGLPAGGILRASPGFDLRETPGAGQDTLAVRFVVPGDARAFEAFNGYVEASAPDGGQAMVPLRVVADPAATTDDAAAAATLFQHGRETSGPSALAALAMAAVALLGRAAKR